MTHKTDSVIFDGNFSLWKEEGKQLTLFAHYFGDKEPLAKAALRYTHNNNQIVTLGYNRKDFSDVKDSLLRNFSYISYVHGGQVFNETNIFAGYRFGLNWAHHKKPLHGLLFGIKDSSFNTVFETNYYLSRESVALQSHYLRATAKVSPKLNLMATLSYAPDKDEQQVLFTADFAAEYAIEEGTKLKARANNQNELSLGLIHNYNKLVNFSFFSRVSFI